MNDDMYLYLAFLFGVLLMSLGIAGAWWTKVRVIWLRQDIYDLRDELFMESVRRDCVQDPGIQAAREHLNAIARVSPVLSISFIANAIQLGLVESREFPRSDDKELGKLIESTMNKAGLRIQRYLLRETLAGLISIRVGRLVSMAWVEDKLITWVQLWRKSAAAEDALRLLGKERKVGEARPA